MERFLQAHYDKRPVTIVQFLPPVSDEGDALAVIVLQEDYLSMERGSLMTVAVSDLTISPGEMYSLGWYS